MITKATMAFCYCSYYCRDFQWNIWKERTIL